jgi:hypothetical protein
MWFRTHNACVRGDIMNDLKGSGIEVTTGGDSPGCLSVWHICGHGFYRWKMSRKVQDIPLMQFIG